jgi:hypothetical protein
LNKKILTIVLFVTLVTGIFAYSPVQAADSSALFSDHFEGDQIDSSKWLVQDNFTDSGYPAFGTSATVANSQLQLQSSGSTFPSVTSRINPFPATGDFAISFGLKYTNIGFWGNGLCISQGPFTKNDFLTTSNILELWADKEASTTSGYVRAYLLGNIVYRDTVYAQSHPTGCGLTVKLEYSNGNYTLYIDGNEISSATSQMHPDTIVLGHPRCAQLPIAPQDSLQHQWSTLEIDYVKMLSQSELSFSTFTESTQIGSKVTIAGTINDLNRTPLADQTVILAYLVPGYPTWTPITSTATDSNGAFSESWMATATGRFIIKARWDGNEDYASASSTRNISVLNDGSQTVFLAESNSTLSSLTFNATSHEISFNVQGPSGTKGYVRFMVSKQFVPNMEGMKLLIDGQDAQCKIDSDDNFWILTFNYNHSNHNVMIKLRGIQVPEFNNTIYSLIILFVTIIVVAIVVRRKDFKHPLSHVIRRL